MKMLSRNLKVDHEPIIICCIVLLLTDRCRSLQVFVPHPCS